MQKHVIEAVSEGDEQIGGLIDDNPFIMEVEYDLDDDDYEVCRALRIYVIDPAGSSELAVYKRDDPETVAPEPGSLLDALLRFAASIPSLDSWEHFGKLHSYVVDAESMQEVPPLMGPEDSRVKEHLITAITSDDRFWFTGTVDGCPYSIRVSDEEDGVCINNGRIFKLEVDSKETGEQLFAYERGWEEEPGSPGQEDLLDALIRFTASLPNHEVWEQSFKQWRYFVVTEDSVLEAAPYDHS